MISAKLNIHILNGRFPGDSEGEITCVANEGSSIVDYMIASSDLFPSIGNFHVCNRSESVHFPVYCFLKLNIARDIDDLTQNNEIVHECSKYKWTDNLKETVLDNFSTVFRNMRQEIVDKITTSINDCVQSIVCLYQTAADCMKTRNRMTSKCKQEPWWDSECEEIKKQKY